VRQELRSLIVSIPNPPDRGYDEHRARAVLDDLIGSAVSGITVVNLDELHTSDDGCDIEADLAVELQVERRGDQGVALFHWAVNFGVEQLCVWPDPLDVVWPQQAHQPRYDMPATWPGWPHGQLVSAAGFKLRESERGLYRVDLCYEQGGLRIETGGLSGENPTSLLLSPLRPQHS
jgi:hypothetical protein